MYEVQSDGTLRWRAGSAVTSVPRANTRVQTRQAGTGYFGAVSVPVSTGRKVAFWLFSLAAGVGALALLYAFLGQEIFQPVEGTDNAFGHIWNFFCKVRVVLLFGGGAAALGAFNLYPAEKVAVQFVGVSRLAPVRRRGHGGRRTGHGRPDLDLRGAGVYFAGDRDPGCGDRNDWRQLK